MSHKRELFEQYEDALFSLLMDQVAEEEGRKAIELNKKLKNDPEAAVPESIQKRCEQTIRKYFSGKTRKRAGKVLWKGIHTAAIITLLLAATLTISFATFPTLRANVFNMIIDAYETHTNFSFESSSETSNFYEMTPVWIPEGFSLVHEEKSIDSYYQYYEDEEQNNIFIQMMIADGQEIALDTEDAHVENITVQGSDATLITENQGCQIIWVIPDYNMCVLVATHGVPLQDALKVAENLKS